MRLRLSLAVLALALVSLTPAALANSYNLFCNGHACGQVTINNISGGVSVNVTMTNGYSLQGNSANGFFFNIKGVGSLQMTNFTTSAGSFGGQFSGTNFKGSGPATGLAGKFGGGADGKFTFDAIQFAPTGKGSNVQLTSVSFNLIGNITTASFVPNGKGFILGVHFCSPGTGKCPSPTGFSTVAGVVPEPGTLSMLGTGLIGLAGLVRRRFRA
ncbi:MAG TPA: PEP-CTERM sorting domain-containing protein [Terriglobales bacterium]|nr:PEP-CTERM sorting domain-containing protein [Terriglobales bacterium]